MKKFFLLAIFLFAANVYAQQNNHFIENLGQVIDQNGLVRNDIRYITDNQNFKLYLRENNFSYELYSFETTELKASQLSEDIHSTKRLNVQSHRVDVELVGANVNPEIIAVGKSNEYYNYYTTGTGDKGVINVHSYEKITYKNIYNNIDLIFYASPDQLKYDFIVKPDGNVADIKLKYFGADELTLENGNIKIKTGQGSVEENIPAVYEKRVGGNQAIKANYILEDNAVRFNVDEYNTDNTLVIDPQLIWGTYFGGSNVDEARDVVTDASGNPVVVGYTASTANIATSGSYQTTYGGGSYDAYIFKMNNDGATMIWATYYGGSEFDQANGIVMDATGDFFIAGETVSSTNISTAGTFQPVFNAPYSNAFIAKFNSAGVRIWGTYYAGGITYAQDIALDSNGDLLIAGGTEDEVNIASAGAHQTVYGGSVRDGWIMKITNNGTTRLWSTYYGDAGVDNINDVYTDEENNVLVTGETQGGANIPTTGAHQVAYGGGTFDAFIAKFDANGIRQWGTYYGGSGDDDWGQGITSDGINNVYVTGKTSSTTDIATTGSYQPNSASNAPSTDAFIVKFNPDGVRQWGTYFGGTGFGNGEGGYAITLDASKNIYVAGQTNSSNAIACSAAHDTAYSFNEDGFAAKFDNNGVCRIWGTYFGGLGAGSPDDRSQGIALDTSGNVIIVGFTQSSSEIASSGAYQTVFGGGFGGGDAFVAKLEDINCANCVSMSASTSVTNNQCFGDCDGTATVNINGGTMPYSYSWSNGQSTQTATNLCSGNFSVTITDASGATTTALATVTSPPAFIIGSISGPDSLLINTSGNYSIPPNIGASYNWIVTNGTVTSGQGTNTSQILWSTSGNGTLVVVVTDSTGCSISDTLIVRVENVDGIANTNSDVDIQLYPVPANDELNLHFKSRYNSQGTIRIFSVDGSLISERIITVKSGDNNYQFKTQTYASGTYLLQFVTSKGVRYMTFVKE